jgi:hypothetical protein
MNIPSCHSFSKQDVENALVDLGRRHGRKGLVGRGKRSNLFNLGGVGKRRTNFQKLFGLGLYDACLSDAIFGNRSHQALECPHMHRAEIDTRK